MARGLRITPGGEFYHVLNRANARSRIFEKYSDYEAFERVMVEALERHPLRVLSYCIMPNHWHLVLWPRADGDLQRFMQWMTLTHTRRWHTHRETIGSGHLYQGRYKSFPIQGGQHLIRVLRYVERNPLRANLVLRAEQWRWGSLWRREQRDPQNAEWLCGWPFPEPEDWLEQINGREETEEELMAIRESAQRGTPFGSDSWRQTTAEELGLESTVRPRGRPRIEKKGSGPLKKGS